jgi:type II secretory pathway predicted ATPase ExeA
MALLSKFGTRTPFRPTPDPDLYSPSATHDAAMATIRRVFDSHGSLVLLEGDAGTGKTLVGLKSLESLPDGTHRIFLQAVPGMKPAELFQAVLFDLGLPYQNQTEHELRLAVHAEMLRALSEDRAVALLVDEAHHLTGEALEELRLLGNLETRHTQSLFVLLLALPTMRTSLNAALQQRLHARCKLGTLDRDERVRFLKHQLKVATGRSAGLITDEAVQLLADHGTGVPRVLNRAAQLSFQIAEAAGLSEVDAEVVLESLQQLELYEPTILPMAAPLKPAVRPKRAPAKKPKRKSA